MHILVAGGLILAGCAGGLGSRHAGTMEPMTICELAEGRVHGWTGLDRLVHDELPACLGASSGRSMRHYTFAILASDVYRPSSGWTVRVDWFMNGGRVALVEVTPASPPDAKPWLAELGPPERSAIYTLDELAASGLSPAPGERIEELVQARRGLSLVVARVAGGGARLLRVRGFAPMAADVFVRDFVRAEPTSSGSARSPGASGRVSWRSEATTPSTKRL